MPKFVQRTQKVVEAVKVMVVMNGGIITANLEELSKFVQGKVLLEFDPAPTRNEYGVSVILHYNGFTKRALPNNYVVKVDRGNLDLVNFEEFEEQYALQVTPGEPINIISPDRQESNRVIVKPEAEPAHRNLHCEPYFFTNATILGKYPVSQEAIETVVGWLNKHLTLIAFNWFQAGNKMCLSMLDPEFNNIPAIETSVSAFKQFVQKANDSFEVINLSDHNLRRYGVRFIPTDSIIFHSADAEMVSIMENMFITAYIKMWQHYRNSMVEGKTL